MYRGSSHFLLVGDSTDIGTLRETVRRLPVDGYGQIFVEVASQMQVEQWSVPCGISVTWLCRDRRADALVPRGELVVRAVDAWVAEWMPAPGDEQEVPYILWIGCSSSDRVDRLYRELSDRIEHAHLHHPHAEH